MEESVRVTLDFSNCKYLGEVFLEMRNKMKWEDWYGENLYAIWDILTGLPHHGDDFTIVRPYFYSNIPFGQNHEFTEYIDQICEVFLRAERMYGEVSVHIEYLP